MKIGKARYALLSDDSGTILDDGIIARLDENRYYVSSSTGNVESVEQKPSTQNPYAPFITSTLQQEGIRKLNL